MKLNNAGIQSAYLYIIYGFFTFTDSDSDPIPVVGSKRLEYESDSIQCEKFYNVAIWFAVRIGIPIRQCI